MSLEPVSRALNVAVLHMASRVCPTGFDVGADAPQSYDELMQHYRETGRIKVWNGASGDSIYADNEVNYAFRAWHDWAHVTGNHPFTLAGEEAACARQLDTLRTVYGNGATVQAWARLLDADCMGQVRYFEEWGAFPTPQRPFVLAYAQAPTHFAREMILASNWHNPEVA